MNFKNEDGYWRDKFIEGSDDLELLIELAKFDFNMHKAPYRVIVKDNNTGEVVFYREKY